MDTITTLYKMDSKQKLRMWEIEIEEEGYEIRHGVVGGVMQDRFTDIWEGKVNRTVDEQIELEARSQIKKRKDKGYVDTVEQAKLGPRNALGLKMPMLAQTFDASKHTSDTGLWFEQYKYNGHRCLITKQKGEVIAYSKRGIRITSVPHITKEMTRLHEDETVDGELYIHGMKLQDISSLVRRAEPDEETAELKYVVYDCIADAPFAMRARFMEEYMMPFQSCLWAPTLSTLGTPKHIADRLKAAQALGYEGLMLRRDGAPYEDDKRSGNLLKVKSWITEEYPVIGIRSGKDNQAILTCLVSPGVTVDATAPGDLYVKRYTLNNKEEFIGRLVQLQFESYTNSGIPFQPVATYWRDPE